MTNYAAGTKLSELTLTDGPSIGAKTPVPDPPAPRASAPSAPAAPALLDAVPARGGPSPPVANTERPARPASGDRFLAKATAELEAGQIDQPLWVRAIAQSGGDEASAKPAYLHARATALRLAKRDQAADRQPRDIDALRAENDAPRQGDAAKRKRMILAAGAIGFLVVVAAIVSMRWSAAPAQPPTVAKASPPGTPAGSAKAVAQGAGAQRRGISGDEFAGKVRELREAGNWNVLVLYAVEWTRKQPGNPQAWKELGAGYAALRQFDDALDAATRAVQVAPGDFEAWQTLGQVNVALEQPAKALVAFERAADLNGRDVTSLVQAGTLNAELGHLAQARETFARALAVSPGDVDALCGAASIAQTEGRPKDAEAFMRQVKSLERVCRDTSAGVSSVPAGSARKKSSYTTR